MTRRLTTALLAMALVVAGVIVGPCVGKASCAAFRMQQMDCCPPSPAGITAVRCCDGQPQVGRSATPATTERQANGSLVLLPLQVALIGATSTEATSHFAPVDQAAAPPGGTLIAQHTSLLL